MGLQIYWTEVAERKWIERFIQAPSSDLRLEGDEIQGPTRKAITQEREWLERLSLAQWFELTEDRGNYINRVLVSPLYFWYGLTLKLDDMRIEITEFHDPR